jgi:formylglycine-generating enzyme required for sulfatase activity
MTEEFDHDIIEAVPFERAEANLQRSGFKLLSIPTAIATVFLILAVAAAFMFLARAVRVDINPVADTFRFTSGFSYKLGDRYLMLAGDYQFTAGKQGYHILESTLTVGDSADQNFTFDLVKLPGILSVSTNPEVNAEVFIDQKSVGITPVTLRDITAGLHDVTFRAKRYLDFNTEIDIEGMLQAQTLLAELQPAWAMVNLSTKPAAAEIYIDEILVGATNSAIEVLQGDHAISLKKKGYKSWQSTITTVAGVDQSMPLVVLEKSDGKVSIESFPAGANININDRYRGQTPMKVVLAPGRDYVVRLTKAGYYPAEKRLSVKPDEDLSLNQNLNPILGSVRFLISPADSQLYVDGKLIKDPTKQLSLPVSRHDIRITKAGYATYSETITPQASTTQQFVVQLQTEDEARIAAIPISIDTEAGIRLKLILPGEFSMGASRREPGRRSNEITKTVELTRPYYLGTTEVSNKQFKLFDRSHDSGILGRALLSDADRPVVNVSWDDAMAFCNWLSEKSGLPLAYERINGVWQAVKPMNTGFRLPTEAEWVWASRYASGPTPTRFPWGDAMPPVDVHGNYADESANSMVPYTIKSYNDTFRGPSPVDHFAPNELGIHDLAGNVAEWLHDYYSVKTPKEKLIDPMGPDQGDYHVIRGSSYKHGRFSELRWTYRDYGIEPRPDVGFRIARLLEQ